MSADTLPLCVQLSGRIHKCGKPCVTVAPSSGEREEGVRPGHVGPCDVGVVGAQRRGTGKPETQQQQTDGHMGGGGGRKVNPPGES